MAAAALCQHRLREPCRRPPVMNAPNPSGSRMLPTDRIDYSAITERPALKLPGGARMAVWVIVNVEEWDPQDTMPRTVLTPPAGGAPMPDIPNWCWHEYGNRVGFWRFSRCSTSSRFPACWRSTAAPSRPIRRSSRRRWTASGSSSATASPSATCRRCRTSTPTSARPPRRSRRRPASRRAAGSGRA